MARRWTPFVENIAESTTACLVTMVQGNLFALSAAHWLIASRTGVIAGAIASAVMIVIRTRRPRVVAVVLGVLTAVVDYFVHPGAFGPAFAEAVVTGAGAAILSLAVAAVIGWIRPRTKQAQSV